MSIRNDLKSQGDGPIGGGEIVVCLSGVKKLTCVLGAET